LFVNIDLNNLSDTNNIITGEKIQMKCDIYCGFIDDFKYNPKIFNQYIKCLDINNITKQWNNPNVIFCYGHRLPDFMKKIQYIQNNFKLITHNSDENITDKYLDIANHPKLDIWYAQNMMVNHPKINILPIGIANSMWTHGNLNIIEDAISNNSNKINDIHFFFNISTNLKERCECKIKLESKGLKFGSNEPFEQYIKNLSTYKYAICPPGNGIDSHRIWECIYLNVIPIVKRSIFTEKLKEKICCIILDDWNEFDEGKILKEYVKPVFDINAIFDIFKYNA
jgi:hypothetical protein